MKMIAAALAATMLLASPVAAPSSAFAGLAAGNLSEAVPQGEHSATQNVRHHRRRVIRHDRRVRHERRLRHERRAVRRCIRRGYCPIVYVVVPVWYTVPIWYNVPIWGYY
jgi:hypothetical protein